MTKKKTKTTAKKTKKTKPVKPETAGGVGGEQSEPLNLLPFATGGEVPFLKRHKDLCYSDKLKKWIPVQQAVADANAPTVNPVTNAAVEFTDEEKLLAGKIALAARDACLPIAKLLEKAKIEASEKVIEAAKGQRRKLLDRVEPKKADWLDVITYTAAGTKVLDQMPPRAATVVLIVNGETVTTKAKKEQPAKEKVERSRFGARVGTIRHEFTLAVIAAKKKTFKAIAAGCGLKVSRVRYHCHSWLVPQGYAKFKSETEIVLTDKEYKASDPKPPKPKKTKAAQTKKPAKATKPAAGGKLKCVRCKKHCEKRAMNAMPEGHVCDTCLDS